MFGKYSATRVVANAKAFVFTDPAQMIVEAAQPENVDTVVADGRILKRGGKLTALSEVDILDGVSKALDGLRKRVPDA